MSSHGVLSNAHYRDLDKYSLPNSLARNGWANSSRVRSGVNVMFSRVSIDRVVCSRSANT